MKANKISLPKTLLLSLVFATITHATTYTHDEYEYMDERDSFQGEHLEPRDDTHSSESSTINDNTVKELDSEGDTYLSDPYEYDLGEDYMEDFSGQSNADLEGLSIDGIVDRDDSEVKKIIGWSR